MQCAILISAMDVEGDARIDYYDLLPVIVHGYRILTSPQNIAQGEVRVSARGPCHAYYPLPAWLGAFWRYAPLQGVPPVLTSTHPYAVSTHPCAPST